jgi:hypothetical protein
VFVDVATGDFVSIDRFLAIYDVFSVFAEFYCPTCAYALADDAGGVLCKVIAEETFVVAVGEKEEVACWAEASNFPHGTLLRR